MCSRSLFVLINLQLQLAITPARFERRITAIFFGKCFHCHKPIADSPASLTIGASPNECINNAIYRTGQSEINARSLIAVHSTASSWEDLLSRIASCILMFLLVGCPNSLSISLWQLRRQLLNIQ